MEIEQSGHNFPSAMDGVGLDLLETCSHSFVVKVWIEETVDEAGKASWRGHITHIPNGERHYLQNLDSIIVFIVPYLEKMGVRLGILWRLKLWLKR